MTRTTTNALKPCGEPDHPSWGDFTVQSTDTATTITMSFPGCPPTITVTAVLNMDHPALAENPDRVNGVEAALAYLSKKNKIPYDLWPYGAGPLYIYSFE